MAAGAGAAAIGTEKDLVRFGGGFDEGVAALEAVVEIEIADRAEGEIVVVGLAGGLDQLFLKQVQSAETIGGGGDLETGGKKKLLISAVNQRGDFPAHPAARAGGVGDGSLRRADEDGAAAMFADFDPICDPGGLDDIKGMHSQIGEGAVEGFGRDFLFRTHKALLYRNEATTGRNEATGQTIRRYKETEDARRLRPASTLHFQV